MCAQEDAVYLLYALPTVVISRRTDQYGKAHETLMGTGAAAGKRARVSFAPLASLPPGPLPGRAPEAAALAPANSAPIDGGAAPGACCSGQQRRPSGWFSFMSASACPQWRPSAAGMLDAAGAGRTGAVLDGGYVRLWIAHRYCAAGFTRALADADMAVRPCTSSPARAPAQPALSNRSMAAVQPMKARAPQCTPSQRPFFVRGQ